MPGPKDYYKALDVDERADSKKIKSAYRRLARKYHPDAGGKGNEERFKEINEAYQVLSNPAKRAEYDRLRTGYANRASQNWGPGFQRVRRESSDRQETDDWSSLFEDLFADSRQWNPSSSASRTAAIPEESVAIGLEEVANGTRVEVAVQALETCPQCRGGSLDCKRCGGLGKITTPKKFDVRVPAGVEDGTVLRVGEHARVKITVRAHPRFSRQGKDLRGRLQVAVPLAAVGGEIEFKPLTGDRLTLKIPAHTNAGKVLRLRGLGLPGRGRSDARGDLLLEVELVFPEPFDEEDDRLYESLLAGHSDKGGEVYAPR